MKDFWPVVCGVYSVLWLSDCAANECETAQSPQTSHFPAPKILHGVAQRGWITRPTQRRDRTPSGYMKHACCGSPTGGTRLRLEPPALRCNPFGVNPLAIHCAGVLEGGAIGVATRTATIPKGKFLFFPILNVEVSDIEAGQTHENSPCFLGIFEESYVILRPFL